MRDLRAITNCAEWPRAGAVPPPVRPAPITFQLSPDGINYHDLYHVIPDQMPTYEVTLPRPPLGGVVTFPAGMGMNLDWVKIRSGTAGTPVVQEADRTFQIVLDVGT
jgi:hypothetical protein